MSKQIIYIKRPEYTPTSSKGKHWSFGKAIRFSAVNKQSPSHYNVPSTFSKRACSFGLGKRWEPSNYMGLDSPSPEKYNIPSVFKPTPKTSPVRYNEHVPQPTYGPGPGAYDVTRSLGHVSKSRRNSVRYVNAGWPELRKDTRDSRPSTPGPGAYEIHGGFGPMKVEKPRLVCKTRNA